MIVGCPKEIKTQEYRVGLTPSNARDYISNGHTVLIETGAGQGSFFTDEEYIAAGAKIVATGKAVWDQADMIVKVKEPLEAEYPFMRKDQIIYTYLHLAAERPLTEALLKSGAKGVAYETITDSGGGLPLLKPMSEVAGRLSIQQGAKFLEKPQGGRGVLLCGVPGTKRAKVLILGAGISGLSAARVAMGFGADVTIMDINLDRLRELDDLYGSAIQTIYSSDANIIQEIKDADLIVTAVLVPGGAAPKLIKKDYLKQMKPGSVIVDISIDQGGCCETSRRTYHDDPIYVVDGIIHYCVGNMPGATPLTSTVALTNATLRQGLLIANNGLEEAIKKDKHIIPGINTYQGKLTYKEVAVAFGMEYTDVMTLL
ncbi:MAG: alanine dehydrogenase [Clostridiales bacterium]|nr:alanine dehydrogenase [Clostridiales bacterium]